MENKDRRPTVEERRPAVRVVVDLEARYGSVGAPSRFEARVVEISATGLRLRTSQGLTVGGSIEVAFDLDDSSRRSRVTVRVRARVVRVVLGEGSPFEYALHVVDDYVKNSLRQAVLKINLSASPEVRRHW